ncbi:MAG: integration host factor subunit alpha [Alphaproteobacteria bacterium]|nr:integration host factor subunit alpha [Alphaproteobacteria bacterium]
MTQRTVTRADIAEALYQELGFSHADSFKLIEKTLFCIVDAFARKEEVKIARFASFIPHAKAKRMGRNPKTGVSHVITERTVLSFKPSNFLKKAIK